MAKKIFITATNTDIGKTYTTKKLIQTYAQLGYKVGVVKPIETGAEDVGVDASALLKEVQHYNKDFLNITHKDITPITFLLPAAPFIASNFQEIDIEFIKNHIKKMEQLCDILLIEGAGGLYVPINKEYMMLDLIAELDVTAFLVTHCSLGCINDTLLSHNALMQRGISHSVIFNCKEKDSSFDIVSKPYFDAVGFEVLTLQNDLEKIAQRGLL